MVPADVAAAGTANTVVVQAAVTEVPAGSVFGVTATCDVQSAQGSIGLVGSVLGANVTVSDVGAPAGVSCQITQSGYSCTAPGPGVFVIQYDVTPDAGTPDQTTLTMTGSSVGGNGMDTVLVTAAPDHDDDNDHCRHDHHDHPGSDDHRAGAHHDRTAGHRGRRSHAVAGAGGGEVELAVTGTSETLVVLLAVWFALLGAGVLLMRPVRRAG